MPQLRELSAWFRTKHISRLIVIVLGDKGSKHQRDKAFFPAFLSKTSLVPEKCYHNYNEILMTSNYSDC